MNAFSPSSTVAKPLCGITGSSGRFGRTGSALWFAEGGRPLAARWASGVSAGVWPLAPEDRTRSVLVFEGPGAVMRFGLKKLKM